MKILILALMINLIGQLILKVKMSNKYNRHQTVISRNSESQLDEDHWLKQFQNKLLEKGAVQPRGTEHSLYDQISSIMNGKSKYPSVAAAVEDMKERSGLSAFLKNLNKTSNDADDSQQTKTAEDKTEELFDQLVVVEPGDDLDKEEKLINDMKIAIQNKDWYELGRLNGELDHKINNITDSVESIKTLKYFYDPIISNAVVPPQYWLNYSVGYSVGAKLSDEERESDFRRTKQQLEYMLREKRASDNNSVINKKIPLGKRLPMILIKCPQAESTFDNVIRSTRGNLSIPAIIDRVRSIHQNDVSDAKYWDSDDLIQYVSKKNLEEKSKNADVVESSNLGSREDAFSSYDIDLDNNDAFIGLMPAKY